MVVGKNNKMQNHINYRYTSVSHLDISDPNIEFKMYKVALDISYLFVLSQDESHLAGRENLHWAV